MEMTDSTVLNNLSDEVNRHETNVENGNLMLESQIMSQDWVEDETEFILTNEGVPSNKTTTYKSLNGNVHSIEHEISENVHDLLTWQQGNLSAFCSRFISKPECYIDHTPNPKLLVYRSPTFKSNATIKLSGENNPKWKRIFYLQFSKICFEKCYGPDQLSLQFSKPVPEEWVLDTTGDADPAYSSASTKEISFTSKVIQIELVDEPLAGIESHRDKARLTKITRNQEFLVFLVMDIDGRDQILHSLKWRTEFTWSTNDQDNPHHRWRIFPNEEAIPKFDITLGTCNKNQMWFLNGVKLLIEETSKEPEDKKQSKCNLM